MSKIKILILANAIMAMNFLEVQASSSMEWTEENIRTSLVNLGKFQELDTLELLLKDQVCLGDIATLLELEKVDLDKDEAFARSLEVAERQSPSPLPQPFSPNQEEDLKFLTLLSQEQEEEGLRLEKQKEEDQQFAAALARELEQQAEEEERKIAQKLAEDFDKEEREAQRKAQLKEQEQLDRDFAAALQIQSQFQEKKPHAPSLQVTPVLSIKKELFDALHQSLEISRTYQDADVHAFNKGFLVPRRHLFTDLQKALQLDLGLPVDPLFEEIKKFDLKKAAEDKRGEDPVLARSISVLKAHNFSDVEGETGLVLGQELSCLISLKNKLATFRCWTTEYLIESLKENLLTKGGCKPGYAGRFFKDILYFSSTYLKILEENGLLKKE